MVIEDDQEVIGSIIHNGELTTQVMKGKRTKRQRPTSPLKLGANCTHNNHIEISPNISVELSNSATVGEEEEDMAHCLILLAQGINDLYKKPSSGLELYKCKTCNKCFPSFQALGGHRASHKKPKVKSPDDEDQKETKHEHVLVRDQTRIDDIKTSRIISTTLSLQTPTNVTKSVKVHECLICGAEFLSGPALGGHMRRHRPSPSPSRARSMSLSTNISDSSEGSQELNKVRTSLELDLNVPAVPEEDLGIFMSKEQVIVFSSSPLVDYHY